MAGPLVNTTFTLGNQTCQTFCAPNLAAIELPEPLYTEQLKAKNLEFAALVEQLKNEKRLLEYSRDTYKDLYIVNDESRSNYYTRLKAVCGISSSSFSMIRYIFNKIFSSDICK